MTERKRTRGKPSTALLTDPQVSAKAAGLRYVTDASPGILRQRAGQDFPYFKEHTVEINDRRLALIVKRCQEIPGQELFRYRDDEGQRRMIDSADVNEYLRQVTDQDFTSKDFRTWNGTVLAARALQTCGVAGVISRSEEGGRRSH